MKVCLTVASFSLNYGGPAQSVLSLGVALSRSGVCVSVWAQDQSAKQLEAYGNLQIRTGALDEIGREHGAADIIHDSGIWLPHNHALVRQAVASGAARVVSPRGMVSPWAMKHKRFKKSIAWSLYQRRDLALANALHATSEAEAEDCRAVMPSVPVFFIPNGVAETDIMSRKTLPARPSQKRVALFLGRLYPVKGIPILLEAWSRVRPSGWTLQLAGPDENGHRAELERLVRKHGMIADITFVGPVSGKEKADILAGAELLVLPSLSESFGMVVAEALEAGIPVLTTTAAPWSDIAKERCGWQVPPTIDGLVDGLRAATARSPEELRQMGERGHAYVSREFGWQEIARRFVILYEHALKSRRRTRIRGV